MAYFQNSCSWETFSFVCTSCSLACSHQATHSVVSLAFYWARFRISARICPFEGYSIFWLALAYWLGLSSILSFWAPVYCSISYFSLAGLLVCFCISCFNLFPVHCRPLSTLPTLKFYIRTKKINLKFFKEFCRLKAAGFTKLLQKHLYNENLSDGGEAG